VTNAIASANATYIHWFYIFQVRNVRILTQIQSFLNGMSLTLDMEGQLFHAVLKTSSDQHDHPNWQTGAKVRITGICAFVHDDAQLSFGIWQPTSFQILLRSPADLKILKPPSWWTHRHITMILCTATGALMLIIGVVVMFSRHRLRQQQRHRQMAEAEFAAILSERNRMAREIHDTLAQGLVATLVHLRLVKKQICNGGASVTQHLDDAQQLVQESLEEARSSIWNMRSQVLENSDLAGALEGILRQLSGGSAVQTSLAVTGNARRLAPVVENNLLRVGQEAITNATRHARATRIAVTLDFAESQFRLMVRDDGRGFDAGQPPPGEGGFGLVGIRERAAQLNGELRIRSAPGGGTEISLSVPLPADSPPALS
jgi:signal transduction histidine kinase